MEELETSIIKLHERYESQPLLKALVQLATLNGFPIGAVADTVLSGYVNSMKTKKLRTFFDELNNEEVKLSPEIIENSDNLHAFFATVNYVNQNRSDVEIKAFAAILKSLYRDEIKIDEFEEYEQILNELTEREFIILSVKLEFEKHASLSQTDLNPLQLTSSYWEDFKSEIKKKLNIEAEELNAILVRIQRTGCYATFRGYFDESDEEIGNTTIVLQNLIGAIQNNG
ncbi:hypothetical protein [Pedobacter sp. SYSU D00535]|uniref:hypothetical protein n=1 Tax=Pedobacter sp. SYSU D00535 TaxID=2810308 RepID=UPI001A965894|nr:hypothetical protein [Pedobacter sp. SYSU D00535]